MPRTRRQPEPPIYTMSHHTVVVCRLPGRRLHRGSGELFCNCMTRRRMTWAAFCKRYMVTAFSLREE
jgi:hypothetical protein